jgi:hypothetical protein
MGVYNILVNGFCKISLIFRIKIVREIILCSGVVSAQTDLGENMGYEKKETSSAFSSCHLV